MRVCVCVCVCVIFINSRYSYAAGTSNIVHVWVKLP